MIELRNLRIGDILYCNDPLDSMVYIPIIVLGVDLEAGTWRALRDDGWRASVADAAMQGTRSQLRGLRRTPPPNRKLWHLSNPRRVGADPRSPGHGFDGVWTNLHKTPPLPSVPRLTVWERLVKQEE